MSELFDINVKDTTISPTVDVEEVSDDYFNSDVSNETEQKDAISELEAYEKMKASENPSSASDVTDDTLKMMFGDNWNGSYVDTSSIVSKAIEEIAWNMTIYSSVSDFLESEKNNITDQIAVNTGYYQIKNSIAALKDNYDNIVGSITNIKGQNIVLDSSNILSSTDSVLSNIESATSSLIALEDKIDGIVSAIQNNAMSMDTVSGLVENQYNHVIDIISEKNIENLLQNFPQSVISKFMGVDFTQELFTMPKQLYSKITNIGSILSSIQAPTNLRAVLSVVKTLKTAVSEMQDVQRTISDGVEKLNTLRSNIQSGNYIGIFSQVKDSCKFLEKTSQFAAKYPYNQAYETESGHIFETDNTPGKERLHVQHCSGTDVEIAPNGDMVSKVKNDMQFVVEKDLQSHVKGNQLTLVDGTSEVEGKSLKLTASDDINVSSKTTTYTADDLNLLTDNTILTASENITVASNGSSSYSSTGPLYITSNSQIILDAPTIVIGQSQASVINVTTSNVITTNSVNNVINSTNININSNSAFIGTGHIKMKGFITLN